MQRKNNKIYLFLVPILFIAIPLDASENTSSHNRSEPSEPNHFVSNAFWLNASLGSGRAFDTDGDSEYWGQLIAIDMSAHFRSHHLVVSSGLQGGISNETHNLIFLYITFGKSFYHNRWEEIIFSGGISYNQLRWNDDMSVASRTDAIFMGIPLQFQYLFHLPVGIGGGIAYNINLNQRAITISFSLQVAFGLWIL